MKRILAFLAAGITGALITLFALSFATAAMAQGPNGQSATSAGTRGNGSMMGSGGRMGGSAESLVGMAAVKLGLTQSELVAQLGTDGTIADTLTAGNVDPAAFIDEFVASRATRLDAAVAANTMTQQDADARLATARSMSTARIYQPFTQLGPGGQGPNAGQGAGHGNGQGFVDANGDGVCDQMPADGSQMRGMRGPHR